MKTRDQSSLKERQDRRWSRHSFLLCGRRAPLLCKKSIRQPRVVNIHCPYTTSSNIRTMVYMLQPVVSAQRATVLIPITFPETKANISKGNGTVHRDKSGEGRSPGKSIGKCSTQRSPHVPGITIASPQEAIPIRFISKTKVTQQTPSRKGKTLSGKRYPDSACASYVRIKGLSMWMASASAASSSFRVECNTFITVSNVF